MIKLGVLDILLLSLGIVTDVSQNKYLTRIVLFACPDFVNEISKNWTRNFDPFDPAVGSWSRIEELVVCYRH